MTTDYRLAHGLSYLINPFIYPPLLFGLVLGHFGAPRAEIGWTMLIGLVFFGVIPAAHVMGMVRRGEAASIELRDRAQRTRPLVVYMLSAGAALALIGWTGTTATALLLTLAGCYLGNAALALLINLRWKISLHLSSLGAFLAVLLFVALQAGPEPSFALPGPPLLEPVFLYPLLLAMPLLMWARVRVGAHTPAQTAAGAVLGFVVPWIELYLIAGAW